MYVKNNIFIYNYMILFFFFFFTECLSSAEVLIGTELTAFPQSVDHCVLVISVCLLSVCLFICLAFYLWHPLSVRISFRLAKSPNHLLLNNRKTCFKQRLKSTTSKKLEESFYQF